MAYTPTEWQSGDIVTSAKLNKIEQGIASASGGIADIIVHATFSSLWDEDTEVTTNTVTADMTPSEAYQHLGNGKVVVISLKSADTASIGLQCVLTYDGNGKFVWSFVDLVSSPPVVTCVMLSSFSDEEWAMSLMFGDIPSNS